MLYCTTFSFKLANISRSYDGCSAVHFLSGHSAHARISMAVELLVSLEVFSSVCMVNTLNVLHGEH